jgi:glucose dehydrogenase
MRLIKLVCITCVVGCRPATQVTPASSSDWTAYGKDAQGSRHSALTQIDSTNVASLAVAWTYHTGEPLPTADRKRSLEVTPLVADGVMYVVTPLGKSHCARPNDGYGTLEVRREGRCIDPLR